MSPLSPVDPAADRRAARRARLLSAVVGLGIAVAAAVPFALALPR